MKCIFIPVYIMSLTGLCATYQKAPMKVNEPRIFDGVATAENAYSAIYQANNKHNGVEVVSGLGNEAYYHSDQTGFYFILVRKNKKMFRLKLNKITSHSSVIEFKEAARRIVDKL